jgi:hypothetical protein
MRKYLLHFLVLLALVAGILPAILIQPSSVSADTWYSTYAYSKQITLTGSTDGAVTNYQMKIVINKGSGSDNSTNVFTENHTLTTWDATHCPTDIRFTDSDNDTLQDFWVESYTATTATVWVEFSTIPASPNTVVYFMYYGLAAAADASNGDNTFMFFDDFNSSWVGQTKWNDTYAEFSTSGGIGTYTNPAAGEGYITSKQTFAGDTAMRMRGTITGVNYSCIGNSNTAFTRFILMNHDSGIGHAEHSNFQSQDGTYTQISWAQLPFDAMHIYDHCRAVTGTDTIKGYIDNVFFASSTTHVPTDNIPVMIRQYNAGSTPVDWVLMRNYRLVEPTWTTWGAEVEMPTDEPPTVTTSAADDIEETTATLNGDITVTGGVNSTVRGFEWGLATGDYDWDQHEDGNFGVAAFDEAITGLTSGELYFFRAYATNTEGTGYGDELTFLTKPTDPNTFVATLTTANRIDLTWVNGLGSDNTIIRALEGDFPANDRSDGAEIYNGNGTSYNHDSLDVGDHWYYKIWSWCTEGGLEQWSDGPIQTNATVVEEPTVVTAAATGIGETEATLNGEITDTGGLNVTIRGFEWGYDLGGPYPNNVHEDGDYTAAIYDLLANGLTPDTTIYFRAYCTNPIGTSYGGELDFDTLLPLPLRPTNFTGTLVGTDNVDLTWTLGTWSTTTIIMRRLDKFPTSLTDGVEVYNGPAVLVTDVLTGTGENEGYYSAWSRNATGDSVNYTTWRAGGTVMLLIALIGLGCFFTFFSAWRRYLPSSMAGSITWLALGSLWLVSPATIGVTSTEIWTPYIGFVFLLATIVPVMLYIKPMTTMHGEKTMKDAFGNTIRSGWEESRQKPSGKMSNRDRSAMVKANRRAKMHSALYPEKKRG